MDKIQIRNLRALHDTGEISLKPITIIVGKNSSGKSSIIRSLPLFKQTVETKTSEPLLWYGRYVDFGDYKQSKNCNSEKDDIDFIFQFKSQSLIYEKLSDYTVQISLPSKKNENVIIKTENYNISLCFEDDKLRTLQINNDNLSVEGLMINRNVGDIIPSLLSDSEPLYKKILFNNPKAINFITNISKQIFQNSKFEIEVMWHFILTNIEKEEFRKDIFDAFNKGKKNKANNIENLESEYHEIENYIKACRINDIIKICNTYLNSYFSNITYIGPVRAVAERYYRVQGLDLQEVDSRGENIAMILRNMKDIEKKGFQEWMNKNFGFFYDTDGMEGEGHTSMYICKDKFNINIADTGFGYSQILPIIVCIWKNFTSTSKNKIYVNNINGKRLKKENQKKIERTIIVEQPELHLHPKMQIQLINTIANIIKQNKKNDIKFIFETHSEHIVNHLGDLITRKELSREDINIILVEQDETSQSRVFSSSYAAEGYLENWPLDFFDGEEFL